MEFVQLYGQKSENKVIKCVQYYLLGADPTKTRGLTNVWCV